MVTCGALVTGLFGMNLLSHLETDKNVFYIVTALIVAGASLLRLSLPLPHASYTPPSSSRVRLSLPSLSLPLPHASYTPLSLTLPIVVLPAQA